MRLVGEAGHLAARVFADLLQEAVGQQRDVARPRAQRRQLDVDHVDAVVQVLAEAAFGDGPRQVFVRGQHDADVDLERLGAADLLELQLLQHAEQLHLHGRAGGADFVEEDRAAVGLQELAHLFAGGAGERAGDVAEQFAFQQVSGSAPQATSTNGPLRRPLRRWIARAIMLLPVPLSPVTSTVARVSATLSIMSNTFSIRGSRPTMLSRPKRRSSCGPQLVVFSLDAALRQGPLDRHQQLVVDQRLGEVVERAGTNGFDRAVGRAVAGDQDDLHAGPIAAALLQQVEAVAVAQADVDQHQVERLAAARRSSASA